MISNKCYQINYEIYFYIKLIWSHKYEYYSLETWSGAPRGRPIVVTGAIRSRPIRVMIQFTNITSKPIRTEASAHARESSYLDARKKIYLFLFSCLMIPFIFLSSFSLLLSYSSIYFPFYTQLILYLLFLFQRAHLGLS